MAAVSDGRSPASHPRTIRLLELEYEDKTADAIGEHYRHHNDPIRHIVNDVLQNFEAGDGHHYSTICDKREQDGITVMCLAVTLAVVSRNDGEWEILLATQREIQAKLCSRIEHALSILPNTQRERFSILYGPAKPRGDTPNPYSVLCVPIVGCNSTSTGTPAGTQMQNFHNSLNHVSGETDTSDEPRRWPEYRHEDLPIRVSVPSSNDDDDFTEVSSVTTAHFQREELFGPSMYPSTQSVGDLEDVSVSETGMDPPSQQGGSASIGQLTFEEETEDRKTTINLDHRTLNLETERPQNKASVEPSSEQMPRFQHGDSGMSIFHAPIISAPQNPRDSGHGVFPNGGSWFSNFISAAARQSASQGPASIERLASAEGTENQKMTNNMGDHKVKLEMQRFSHGNAVTTGEIDPSQETEIKPEIQERGSSTSIFSPLPMPLPTAQENSMLPDGPGAYRVSPFGSVASRERDEQEEKEGLEMVDLQQQTQEEPHREDSDLVQAWPVSDELIQAVPLQDTSQDTGNFTYFAGKVSWKLAFVGLVAVLAAVLSSSITVPLLFAKDPHKIEHTKMKNAIIDAFGEDYFDNPQKERALHWSVYEDPRNSLSSKEEHHAVENLIQRYSLAAFYFQTSSQQPWAYCNPPVDQQSEMCYYEGAHSRTTDTGRRWLTAAHECQWMGVSCSGGTKDVTELSIRKNNLTGTIPAYELATLTQLKTLRLTFNNFSGSLPVWIFERGALEHINLSDNKLTGSIPMQAFLLPTLHSISLDGNQFTGTIPSQIGQFKGIVFGASRNLLSGSIPGEMYTAKTLQDVSLQSNLLTGSLSSAVGCLTGLWHLVLSGNQIQGSLPSQIGLLCQLKELNIDMTKTRGTIPEELYENKDLETLSLSGCSLAGTISTRIGQLTSLQTFRIDNNNIHGTVPREIADAPKLCHLYLHGNSNLTGAIPDKFCSHLRQGCNVTADCKAPMDKDVPPVQCAKHCCSACCDAETNICLDQ